MVHSGQGAQLTPCDYSFVLYEYNEHYWVMLLMA
ncbi:hypothetical protein AFERRI_120008 [Acidithiobacillus ferrivorans]|uniref:Uncharacterized protein n=1 Tax=Acidithiobacillus ferrivorans TaxID=160808 RepID=A0A060UK87_9PROT|nr:hypothetical protein AFERRI_120008 [Acidithiobacillus ferrivorans]